MDIKVTIELKDEFDQILIGQSEGKNLTAYKNHVEALSDYLKQAVLAMGFHPDNVNEVFGIFKEEV